MKQLKLLSTFLLTFTVMLLFSPIVTIAQDDQECHFRTAFAASYISPLGITAEVAKVGLKSPLTVTGGIVLSRQNAPAKLTDAVVSKHTYPRHYTDIGVTSTVMYKIIAKDYHYRLNIAASYIYYSQAGVSFLTGANLYIPIKTVAIFLHPLYDITNKTPLIRVGFYF